MRLRAAGAVPGRVGKCPACGGVLRVPDAIAVAVADADTPPPVVPSPSVAEGEGGGDDYPLSPAPTTTSFAPNRERGGGRRTSPLVTRWNGVMKPRAGPETRIRNSLLYPLR